MLNNLLNRKVLLGATIKVLTEEAKLAFTRNLADRSMSSLVAYTQPEQIPDGFGVMGFMIVMDHSSQISEISPEMIIAGNSDEYMQLVLRANTTNDLGVTRKQVAITVGSAGAVSQLISLYNVFSGQNVHQLTSVSNIDVRGVMPVVAEIISEDLKYMKNYIEAIQGNINRLVYEGATMQTPIGPIIKQGNRFEFPDGIVIVANNVFRNPDGSFNWDYQVALGNELMRSAKDDGAFTVEKTMMSYGNGGGYNPYGGMGY